MYSCFKILYTQIKAFVNRGMRMVSAGANPVALRRGMMDSVGILVKKLKEIATPVNGVDDIRNIATVHTYTFIYIRRERETRIPPYAYAYTCLLNFATWMCMHL
jgi:chaperonin GroEL (HSP60 family)